MSLRTEVTELLQARKRAHSLPGRLYTDPAVFALDMEAIFHRQWLFAGAACEVEAPGQYLTVQLVNTSVIVARGRDGVLRGFFNSCRHRGFKLCEQDRGEAKSFVCQYHRWTYRLDGSLAYASYMPEEFDKGEHGLKPVQVRELCGAVYFSLAQDPPNFDAYAEAVRPLLAPHRLEGARVAHRDSMVVEGNWKLMMENSRECYHCATEHRTLMRTFLDIYDWTDPAQAGAVKSYLDECEALGLPSHIAEGPEFRAGRLPFTKGAVSTTMDGTPACSLLLGDAPRQDIGSLRWVHYPTVFNHALGDYAVMVQMLPLSPLQTQVNTTWLVNRDAVEGEHYELQNLIKVWSVTNEEDGMLVKRNQQGVNSIGYEPGPYSRELEAGVIKFVDWYCAQMLRHLGAPALARIAA